MFLVFDGKVFSAQMSLGGKREVTACIGEGRGLVLDPSILPIPIALFQRDLRFGALRCLLKQVYWGWDWSPFRVYWGLEFIGGRSKSPFACNTMLPS